MSVVIDPVQPQAVELQKCSKKMVQGIIIGATGACDSDFSQPQSRASILERLRKVLEYDFFRFVS